MTSKYKSLRRQQEQSLRMKHIKFTPLKLYPKTLLSLQLPTAHLNYLTITVSFLSVQKRICTCMLEHFTTKKNLLLINRVIIL